MTIRYCIRCNAEIDECMGLCLGRDVAEAFEMINRGQQPTHVRELCGRCGILNEIEDNAFMKMLYPKP